MAFAQSGTAVSDTIAGRDSLTITAQPFMQRLPSLSAVGIGTGVINTLDRATQTSLVSGLNTMAGVRMEERSPGSYRLNMRGSSLRSPFGVRNVKLYWNNIPLTDPGGNTYLNQLAVNAPQNITVFKGPAGSMYGAGTGGLVLLSAWANPWQRSLQFGYGAGSFGLLNVNASADVGDSAHRHRISYMHNEASGYRDQSAMRRDNIAFSSNWQMGERHLLSVSVLASSLYYQTPGGLTPAQFAARPRDARPAAGTLPSAVQAKAAIFQTNMLAGVYHQYQLNNDWHTETALYAAWAEVRNPSIRNYENRLETHAGLRSMLVYKKQQQNTAWQWSTGIEYQYGRNNVQVANNVNGSRGETQTNDDVHVNTGFVFTQLQANMGRHWQVVAGASINYNAISIIRNNLLPVQEQYRRFGNAFTPRVEVQYQWHSRWTTQLSFSKGYSPPTAAEVLPSTGIIDLSLDAESGYNYELANNYWLIANRLQWTMNLYYFKLRNALVQQRDAAGADFFVNAGGTAQYGMEQSVQYLKHYSNHAWLKYINAAMAYTWSHFTYSNYVKLGSDFSGNRLPGIPVHSLSATADLQTRMGMYASITYVFNSRTWLNDANSFAADAFHLLGLRLGYQGKLGAKWYWKLFGGIDNLLNENYGLGHDINAFGNRFYNAAPTRNYYAGISFGK